MPVKDPNKSPANGWAWPPSVRSTIRYQPDPSANGNGGVLETTGPLFLKRALELAPAGVIAAVRVLPEEAFYHNLCLLTLSITLSLTRNIVLMDRHGARS